MARETVEVQRGESLLVELWYPEMPPNPPSHVEIDLVSVRSSDGIRVKYSFERDGWIIEQPTYDAEGEESGWQEVAFAKSWALEKSEHV